MVFDSTFQLTFKKLLKFAVMSRRENLNTNINYVKIFLLLQLRICVKLDFLHKLQQDNISQHMKEVDIRIHLPFINQRVKRFEKKRKTNAILLTKFDLEIKLFSFEIFHLC